MESHRTRYVYGPVPSRRLGRSLGIDLVPYKICTYDCIYCQLGRTTHRTVVRRAHVPADAVMAECAAALATIERPDVICLAGSGEPTLNSAIGHVIRGLKQCTDLPVAVLTNGALLWQKEVQEDLLAADLVLPSLDAGDEALFQRINRPHPALSHARMVGGLAAFTRHFAGEVWLEVLLLAGLTDTQAAVARIADQVETIRPARVQLNTACRPPAETIAAPVSAGRLQALAGLFPCPVDIVSHDVRDAASAPLAGRATETDIMALLARRPCTAEDVARGLGLHINEALKHLEALATVHRLRRVANHRGIFYILPLMKADP
jgi:wyosine [tRNA(Phe)-imidazoG37] synthetase (radical SAM superfamily)